MAAFPKLAGPVVKTACLPRDIAHDKAHERGHDARRWGCCNDVEMVGEKDEVEDANFVAFLCQRKNAGDQ